MERSSKIIFEERRRSTFANKTVLEGFECTIKICGDQKEIFSKAPTDSFDKLSVTMSKTDKDENFLLTNNKHIKLSVFS